MIAIEIRRPSREGEHIGKKKVKQVAKFNLVRRLRQHA